MLEQRACAWGAWAPAPRGASASAVPSECDGTKLHERSEASRAKRHAAGVTEHHRSCASVARARGVLAERASEASEKRRRSEAEEQGLFPHAWLCDGVALLFSEKPRARRASGKFFSVFRPPAGARATGSFNHGWIFRFGGRSRPFSKMKMARGPENPPVGVGG